MKFAVTYPMLSHPADPEVVSGHGVAAVASAVEAAGFSGFGFTDHPAPPQRWLENGGHDALDPFVAMSFAAAVTSSIRLIPNIVVLPYRNPLLVAKSGATLDLLSGGRFTLAVGAGYLKREFAALGVDFDERNELFDEALDVIRAVWTSDDVHADGRRFSANGVTAHPRPVSTPHPPIWIGGNTGTARRRVAQHGDGWCPFAAPPALANGVATAPMDTIERLSAGLDDLRRRLEHLDRDPAAIDVAFTNHAGGIPGTAGFDADEHLDQLDRLATLGVTWIQVSLPGHGLSAVLEGIECYRDLVIAPLHRGSTS